MPHKFDISIDRISARIQKLREGRAYTQVDVARRLGVSRQTYIDWETPGNNRWPHSLDYALRFFTLYGCTPNYLWFGEEVAGMHVDKRYQAFVDTLLTRMNHDAHFAALQGLVMSLSAEQCEHLALLLQLQWERGYQDGRGDSDE